MDIVDQKRQTIEKRFNRIVIFFYCPLIFFLPISIALVETMAGFVILFFTIKKITLNVYDIRQKPALSWFQRVKFILSSLRPSSCYLNVPMGLFVAAVFVSILQSNYFSLGLTAFVAKLLEGYFLYFSFVECVASKKYLRFFLGAYLASVTLMVVNGLTQYVTHTEFVRGTALVGQRVSSSLRHANDFGAYLILIIPVMLGIILLPSQQLGALFGQWVRRVSRADQIIKILLFLFFIAVLTCMGLTYSRGSWFGFAISLVIFALIWRRNYLFVIFTGIIFLTVFTPLLTKVRDVSFVSDNVHLQIEYANVEYSPENLEKLDPYNRSMLTAAHHFGGMGRAGYWEQAWGVFKQRPILGSGLNTYSKLAPGYPHNCYLQMAGEIGIVGLTAFLVMIFVLFWNVIKQFPSRADPFVQAVLAGAMAGFLGFLVQSFFDTTLYSVQLGNLMWIFMGLIVATSRLVRFSE